MLNNLVRLCPLSMEGRNQKIPKKLIDKRILGFTMIEIIAVLVIISVLAAVAVTKIGSTQRYSALAEADILKAYLRYVNFRALSDIGTWGMRFDGTSYTMLRNGSAATYNLPNENSSTHTMPDGITVAGDTVIFDEWGTPVNASGSPVTENITINIAAGGETIPITITKNTGFIP